MGSPLVQLHLTLVTLKGHCHGHPGFEGLYLVKKVSWTICYYKTLIGNHIVGAQRHFRFCNSLLNRMWNVENITNCQFKLLNFTIFHRFITGRFCLRILMACDPASKSILHWPTKTTTNSVTRGPWALVICLTTNYAMGQCSKVAHTLSSYPRTS